MGVHICEYLKEEEGKRLGLMNMNVYYSSGDVMLSYSSGRSWCMPDMVPLYIELGWLPPKEFIQDVMTSTVTEGERSQTRGPAVRPVSIGYINPKDHPLPRPFKIHPALPEGFMKKLKDHMTHPVSKRNQTKSLGFKPGFR